MTASPSTPERWNAVVLIGFMGSGKTSVGRRLAALLGWEFVDVDDRIEERADASVEEIFRERGEAAFREMEAEVARDALAERPRVVAPGGGWAAARPGRLASLGSDVLTVWLRVEPEVAVERSRVDGPVRPLLDVDDPVAVATELLERRTPFYEEARLHLDTADASPERLARDIVEHLRTGGRSA